MLRLVVLILMLVCGAPALALDLPKDPVKLQESDFARKPTWFNPKNCKKDPGKNMYFHVGATKGADFKLERHQVTFFQPNGKMIMTKEGDNFVFSFDKNVGCPENPMIVYKVAILDSMMLVHYPTNHEKQLLKLRDSGECPEEEPGILHCKGNQTVYGVKRDVEYYMLKDKKALNNSGGPKRVRCLTMSTGAKVCAVTGIITEEVVFDFIVSKPDIRTIEGANNDIPRMIETLRVK